MTAAAATSLADLLRASSVVKGSREWQEQLWAARPLPNDWPASLDVFEGAAYLRVSHVTIRRLCVTDREGKAKLRHKRIAGSIRVNRGDLDRLGVVNDRTTEAKS